MSRLDPPTPLLQRLLRPVAALYALLMTLRNAYYDRFAAARRRVGVPVISVGNLTVGGTGKTPMVMEIVQRLRRIGRQPAILTRGYGAGRHESADEVLEYGLEAPGVLVVVNPDRVAGAETAVRRRGADCLVLDDGFQHRRLARDLDVVLIDALNPWGGGRVLPAGRLREPVAGLARADAVIVTRANQAPAGRFDEIAALVQRVAPRAAVLRAGVALRRLAPLEGEELSAAALHGARVLPVCGIGNPQTFLELLRAAGAEVASAAAARVYPDHHAYTGRDAAEINAAARAASAAMVLTTRKDWVKLAPLWVGLPEETRQPLVRVDVRPEIDDPAGVLDELLVGAVS